MLCLSRRKRLAILPGLALLASCAAERPVTVESMWIEGVTRDQQFDNLLIIAVTPNYNPRCNYEILVASFLRTDGVTATASCSHLDSTDPLTVDTVRPIVAELDIDAVLVSELIGRDDEIVEGGSSEQRGEAYYKPIGYGYGYPRPYYYGGYYGAFGLPVTYVKFTAEQSAFGLETSVVVASNLFETNDAQRVFSVQVTAEKQTMDQVLHSVSTGVADRLRRDGLVP
ncbi:MAG: hypothetical protein QNJ73_16540 [Gammaproteobacteria bacterium]|nr:hypothetical protein [Gammaproteobacteria bacterium]